MQHDIKTQNYIFDFDGTIADVLEPAISIIQDIAAEYTVTGKIDRTLVRRFTLAQIMKQLKISKLKLFFILLRAKREMRKLMPTVKIFPEMKEVIVKLAQNHQLFILSSNSQENINIFLKHHKLENFFMEVATSPFVFQKHRALRKLITKHHLKKSETLYIGDEKRDVIAAHRAGISACAVIWGFDNEMILQKARPEKIIHNPRELLHIHT